MTRFKFRGVAPTFVERPFTLQAGAAAGGLLPLWVKGPDGELAMDATATMATVG